MSASSTSRPRPLKRRQQRKWIVPAIVTVGIYLACFNVIKQSGSVTSQDMLLLRNESYNEAFFQPKARTTTSSTAVTKSVISNTNDSSVGSSTPSRLLISPPLSAMNITGHNSSSTNQTPALADVDNNKMIDSHDPVMDLMNVVSSSNMSGIPRLPVIPKPNPLPSKIDVINTMRHANETHNPTGMLAGQFCLDFAVIGMAKCGTSTMMVWLGQQENIFVPAKELTILKKQGAWELVNRLYEPLPEDLGPRAVHSQQINQERGHEAAESSVITTKNIHNIEFRAYKAPNDIDDFRSLRMLREHFPQTKLVVGIRHPILMIESFYNHRIQNGFPISSFPLIGWLNSPKTFGVTWNRAAYHSTLINLGKTPLNTTDEIRLMPVRKQAKLKKASQQIPKSPHPVFLYEMGQLKGEIPTGTDKKDKLVDSIHDQSENQKTTKNLDIFVRGLENFLGLTEKSLPPPIQIKPGKVDLNSTQQEERNRLKIDICSKRYKPQRKVLLEIGSKAANWIVEYFLKSPDVYVANLHQFRGLVSNYGVDPCIKRNEMKDRGSQWRYRKS